jgi:hypothetical protein
MMIGFILNSGGFGDSAKHLTITKAIREHHLDLVVISETG